MVHNKYLYIIVCKELSIMKVGVSSDPLYRLRSLSKKYEMGLYLHSVFDVGSAFYYMESSLHKYLEDYNIAGFENGRSLGVEWFSFECLSIVSEIKQEFQLESINDVIGRSFDKDGIETLKFYKLDELTKKEQDK